MNGKKLLAIYGLKWNPFFTRAPQRTTAGDAQDRALRLARRTVGLGGRLRAGNGCVGYPQVGGAADRRRAASEAARRHGRRDRSQMPGFSYPPRPVEAKMHSLRPCSASLRDFLVLLTMRWWLELWLRISK